MFADAALAHLASHAQGEPPAQHDGKDQTSLQGDLEELGRRTAASGVAQGFACGASRLAYEKRTAQERREKKANGSGELGWFVVRPEAGERSAPNAAAEAGLLSPSWRIVYERKQRLV